MVRWWPSPILWGIWQHRTRVVLYSCDSHRHELTITTGLAAWPSRGSRAAAQQSGIRGLRFRALSSSERRNQPSEFGGIRGGNGAAGVRTGGAVFERAVRRHASGAPTRFLMLLRAHACRFATERRRRRCRLEWHARPVRPSSLPGARPRRTWPAPAGGAYAPSSSRSATDRRRVPCSRSGTTR